MIGTLEPIVGQIEYILEAAFCVHHRRHLVVDAADNEPDPKVSHSLIGVGTD